MKMLRECVDRSHDAAPATKVEWHHDTLSEPRNENRFRAASEQFDLTAGPQAFLSLRVGSQPTTMRGAA